MSIKEYSGVIDFYLKSSEKPGMIKYVDDSGNFEIDKSSGLIIGAGGDESVVIRFQNNAVISVESIRINEDERETNETPYKNGLPEGEQVITHEDASGVNGEIVESREIITWKSGILEGPYKFLTESREIIGNYSNGVKVGKWIEFDRETDEPIEIEDYKSPAEKK